MNKILYGFLAGLAVGLLIAPASGAETRKKIADNIDDTLDNMKDVVDKIRTADDMPKMSAGAKSR